MYTQRLLLLLTLGFTPLLITVKAFAGELKILDVAVGWGKPPYIDQKNHSGYEIELVEDIMLPLGYRLNFLYVPYGRSLRMLQSGHVDLMLTAHDRLGIDPKYLSEHYIVYQNVAVTLKRNHIKINRIEDLSKHSLVSFQNARLVLGNKFHDVVESNPSYTELPDQRNQVEMLFKGKTSVIVLDRNIFTYFERALSENRSLEDYEIHPIFPENHYKVAFKNPDIKSQFNQSLAQFIKTKEYILLQEKYALSSQVRPDSF
ncbi:substrate-binding periplasmic protein [Alteromonas sp. a30]|uniref:substrate-binding periplasmic protein n=1 Tax=Alteromonas sp. a30 TaxID=2730917 RepID=UPI002282A5F7|nr:transporter substrate-binding domain-containing protein [Alteromonas sp. a30]MCY7294764.1 transporter substrate-binding domain-containing protein [Alteromonas sp. a30]